MGGRSIVFVFDEDKKSDQRVMGFPDFRIPEKKKQE